MSYNLYLTHKENWFDEKPAKNIISKNQFKQFIKSRDDLTIKQETEKQIIAHYETPDSNGPWTVEWNDGDIRTNMRTVPREVFKILIEMSKLFNVDLQGEECERYTEADSNKIITITELTNKESSDKDSNILTKTKKYRKTRLNLLLRITFVMIVGLIVILMLLGSGLGLVLIPLLIFPLFRKKRD